MNLLERILVATDFTKSSENVVKTAIDLAKIFQSQIILIHVLPDTIKNEKAMSLLKEASFKMLEVIRDRIQNESIKTDKPILEIGSPYDVIVQTSVRVNANTILIGSGEKTKDDVFQLGITAEKIIRKSEKPVWVVKKDSQLNVKNILCPVDFSRTSKRALKNTITLARRFKATLIIFSVCEEYYPHSLKLKVDWKKENKRVHAEHTINFDKFLKEFNLVDLNWKKEIHGGDPAKEILRAILRNKSDLLVIGTAGKTGINRMIMGSVTEKVIREVPCSFITLKAEDIIHLQLEGKIRDIESHFATAKQLMKDGFFEEAINEFKVCLNINNMHIPSLNGIAKVYGKLKDKDNAEKYKSMAKEILARIWDRKIEMDIRKFYKF